MKEVSWVIWVVPVQPQEGSRRSNVPREKVMGKQRLRRCTAMKEGLGAQACSLEAAEGSP